MAWDGSYNPAMSLGIFTFLALNLSSGPHSELLEPPQPSAWVAVVATEPVPLFATSFTTALIQERFRERQVLDPQSQEWVEKSGSSSQPSGPVDEARSLLARNQGKAALRLLKKWTKNNRSDERYYEAVYLLGEAYFETEDFYAAYEQYEQVVDNTSGDLFQKALRREMDVARAFFAGKKRRVFKILWLRAYEDGATILGRIWERVPGTRLGEEALKLKADYRYEVGEFTVAQQEYALMAKEYPYGRYTRYAMLRSAESASQGYAGIDFEDRGLIDAQERYRQLKQAFPEFADREKVDDRLERIRLDLAARDLHTAQWYERSRHPGAAAWYYRQVISQWPDTLSAAEARARLRALGYDVPEESSK